MNDFSKTQSQNLNFRHLKSKNWELGLTKSGKSPSEMQKAALDSWRLKSWWYCCGEQDILVNSAGDNFSSRKEPGWWVQQAWSCQQSWAVSGGQEESCAAASRHPAALPSIAGCAASCHTSISKLIQLNGPNDAQIGIWLYFCFCSQSK